MMTWKKRVQKIKILKIKHNTKYKDKQNYIYSRGSFQQLLGIRYIGYY